MDNQLVTDWLSDDRGGGKDKSHPPHFSYTEILDKKCPQYLAMGMSYEDYWYGDPEKAKFFREAYLYKLEARNRKLWVMGRYVYDAIFANSPVLRAFGGATSPRKYLEEPYAITDRMAKEREEIREAEEQRRAREDIEAQIMNANKSFRERTKKDGRDPGT